MLYFSQQVLGGLHISAIYALLAFGYTLVHGLLHRANLAFGALFAFGGQMLILSAVFGWQALWLTLPAAICFGLAMAFAFGALASLVLARSVLAPLAEASPNAIIAATLGAAIALVELARVAADTRDFWLPPLLAEPMILGHDGVFALTFTPVQALNVAIAIACLVAASAAMGATRWGRLWRAAADDPGAARMCGVDTGRVFVWAVIAGGAMATLAGALAALHYGNIGFGTGMAFGLKVLFVTAVGGYRSPGASAAGAALFGMVETLWSGYFPLDTRDIAMFALLIVLLVLVPRTEGRALP